LYDAKSCVLADHHVDLPRLGSEGRVDSLNIEISVIIATRKANSHLSDCLSALYPQMKQNNAEIVVVESHSTPVADSIKQLFPEVNFVSGTGSTSLLEMKAEGIRAARGSIIALVQAHCLPSNDWIRLHKEAHQQLSASAIGGAVVNRASATVAERFAFLCEYGKFNANRCAGPASFLASSNVSYKKLDLEKVMKGDYWEMELHKELCDAGNGLWYFPNIVVVYQRKSALFSFLLEKFHYSRYFASRRFENKCTALLYASGCALLPAIVWVRLLTTLSTNEHRYSEFIISIPYFIAITIAWTLGELVGYVFGSGNSEKHFG
jgi:glycosyltransferase involved in cell wall biosynthesis